MSKPPVSPFEQTILSAFCTCLPFFVSASQFKQLFHKMLTTDISSAVAGDNRGGFCSISCFLLTQIHHLPVTAVQPTRQLITSCSSVPSCCLMLMLVADTAYRSELLQFSPQFCYLFVFLHIVFDSVLLYVADKCHLCCCYLSSLLPTPAPVTCCLW
jgi:hypothetical protein